MSRLLGMNKLGWYLFKQTLTAFVFTTLALTFVLLFVISFRLLSFVINSSGTMLIFGELMSLSIPALLPIILPIALGAAVIFVYHKFAVDSELTVMRAAGISSFRIGIPALILTAMVMVGCFLLTTTLAPWSNRELVTLQYRLKDTSSVFLARPGVFNDLTDGLTFYARTRDSSGVLKDILIHDVRNAARPVTVMAEKGQITTEDGTQQIIVFNGRRQEVERETGRLSELNFDRYRLDLSVFKEVVKGRKPDTREQTMAELANPPADPALRRTTLEKIAAEFHQRLATPLLPLCFALIGLAAILAGEFNRRGMNKRLVTAALAIILVQAAMLSVGNLIAKQPALTALVYLVPLLTAGGALLLLIAPDQRRHPSPTPKASGAA